MRNTPATLAHGAVIGPVCPACHAPRRIIVDALRATTVEVCDTCDRNAQRAAMRERYLEGAIRAVAQHFGLSVDALVLRLRQPARARCVHRPKPCKRCRREFQPTSGRADYCHLPDCAVSA